VEFETVDPHAEAAELDRHVRAAGELEYPALPISEDIVPLAGIPAEAQRTAGVIEHDRLLGKGACKRDEVWELRVIKPRVEAQAEFPERGEAFAELGVVAVEVPCRIGVAVMDRGLLVLPAGGMADALEAWAGSGHVRAQDFLGTRTDGQVDQADDACRDPCRAIVAARRHGSDAVDELRLAKGAILRWTIGAIAGRALDEHGRLDAMPAAGIGQQIGQQVAVGRKIPQMVMRVDDG
jgi:hypothetical protein